MKTIKLDRPVIVRSMFGRKETITEVQLKPIVVKDMFGLNFSNENALKSSTILASRLSGIEEKHFELMDMTDFTKITEALGEMITGRK